MIIGVCGFCSTGSSAVSDYLKEFDENQVLDNFEFTIPYITDGLEDLEYQLKKSSRGDDGYCAMIRFKRLIKLVYPRLKINEITDRFLKSLVQVEWYGIRRPDMLLKKHPLFYRYFGLRIMRGRIIPIINKILGRSTILYPNHKIECSIDPENFEVASKKFISEILLKLGADFSKNIVLDQPFLGGNPAKSFHFFNEPVAIVVDRDPRDNYLFTKKVLYKKQRIMPIDTVEDFVKYYKLLRDNQPYKYDDMRILRVQFEDMVYNYESTAEKIRRFCSLPENKRKFTIFDPKISMPNTQLFRRYPEYEKDIKYIEKELSEYLFNFQSYPVPEQNGKMFVGKSPLNK